MYQPSMIYRDNLQLIPTDYEFIGRRPPIPNIWSRTYGLNGGGGFHNILGMGSSIAGALGHKELGGMLGMAHSFVGKYGNNFANIGMGNGFGANWPVGQGGIPGAGMPGANGFGSGLFGSGFPNAMGQPGFMGNGFPGTMGRPPGFFF